MSPRSVRVKLAKVVCKGGGLRESILTHGQFSQPHGHCLPSWEAKRLSGHVSASWAGEQQHDAESPGRGCFVEGINGCVWKL